MYVLYTLHSEDEWQAWQSLLRPTVTCVATRAASAQANCNAERTIQTTVLISAKAITLLNH
jgi:hypothetical protein